MVNKEILDRAYHWLNNAIRYELEKKPIGIVNKALQKACDLELEAWGFKPAITVKAAPVVVA